MNGIVIGSQVKSRNTGENYQVTGILPCSEMVQVIPVGIPSDSNLRERLTYKSLNNFILEG